MAKELGLKKFPTKANIKGNWTPAGQTATRKPKPLYKRQRGKLHTQWAADAAGNPDYRRNSQGEVLYRKRILTHDPAQGINQGVELKTETFHLVDEGNGNVRMQKYEPPTAEQLAKRQRREQAQDLMPALADELIAQGLTVEEIVARLKSGPTTAPAPAAAPPVEEAEPDPEEDLSEFPKRYAPGRYHLADGTSFQGKKEAAEKANDEIVQRIAEAKDAAEALKDWQE